MFLDPNEAAVGSTGYFSPSGHSATRGPCGWVFRDVSFMPRDDEFFTSHHGPANDEKLVELLAAARVTECGAPGESDPPHGLCGGKADHQPHSYISGSLDEFRCTADQESRLPYAAEIQQKSHPTRGSRLDHEHPRRHPRHDWPRLGDGCRRHPGRLDPGYQPRL
ncbi:hypothetical protein PV331_29355 [Streptomyces sp. WI04-05B]|nr:hypothetical protein [Streptomyces sp. WI04-05B]